MSKKYTCNFCKKSLSKSNKSRHLSVCKMKKNLEHLEQIKTEGLGNTELNPAPKKQGKQSKKWCFTINNPLKEDLEQIEHLLELSKILIYQYEIGSNGTLHIQGFLILNTRRRLTELKKFLNRAHLEIMKGDLQSNIKYCTKVESRKEGTEPFYFGYKPPKKLKLINPDNFYPWQKTLIEMLREEPNDRDILWIYGDYKTGKTQFVKYMCHELNSLLIYGAERHILAQVGNNTDKDVFYYMCVKGQSNVPFQAMERIKDGHFCMSFGTKNNKQVIMNSPHLVIFSNMYPNEDHKYFHEDKTIIYEINSKKELCRKPARATLHEGS